MTSKEKIETLRNALGVIVNAPGFAGYWERDPKALQQAETALAVTTPRAQMTKEEKEVARKARRFESHQNYLVKWLRRNGMLKGNRVALRSDANGTPFIVIEEPDLTKVGLRMRVRPADSPLSTGLDVDPMLYRPLFEAAAPDTARATVAKAHRKSA